MEFSFHFATGLTIAISGQVKGSVCLVQLMHPVYSLCITFVFGISLKPSEPKNSGAKARTTVSRGWNAAARDATASTRARPIPRLRNMRLTATETISSHAPRQSNRIQTKSRPSVSTPERSALPRGERIVTLVASGKWRRKSKSSRPSFASSRKNSP